MTNNIEELLAPYALDAVTDQERVQVEAAVETDPSLRVELEAHLGTARLLAASMSDEARPSDDLWERIATATAEPMAEVVTLRPTWTWREWLVGAVAAAAVVAVAVLGVLVAQQSTEIDELTAALAEDPVSRIISTAAAAPGSELLTLVDPNDPSSAVTMQLVVTADGTGYVIGHSLPDLAVDRTYQLWAVVEDRVISAGVLGRDPSSAPFQFVADVTAWAVTEEIEGGVVSSENDPTALWIDA